MRYTEAFECYHAKLTNRVWSCSAKATDGSIVVSCWQHLFVGKQPLGIMRYEDSFSRWGGNEQGQKEMKAHLKEAFKDKLNVRLVIARAESPEKVRTDQPAHERKNDFHVREDMVGEVVEFDGDRFVIIFRKNTPTSEKPNGH